MYIKFYCFQILINLNFLDKFSETLKNKNMKILQVRAEFFHADGQMDRCEGTAFLNFAKTEIPLNWKHLVRRAADK